MPPSSLVLHPSNPGQGTSTCLDLAHLPPDDPEVYRMLQAADTVGIFQVESRAQMATLPRLRPTCFYDLVVEVALIRPGPIVGQMVHPYLKRRKGEEPVSYPHPSLEPVLKRTLGVPLFQEQLLRIAMVAADFSGGEAEELRRAMGFKRSEERMRTIEVKLRAGMARNGIVGEEAEKILLAITSFALYGFPESHAASFALIVYASAYLKTYYPAAFYAALLNNQPMGFYHPATLVKDAQRRGVRFAPIDVQDSDWDCRVQEDGAIRLGLRFVQGLREAVGRAIAAPPRAGVGASHVGAGFSRPTETASAPRPASPAWAVTDRADFVHEAAPRDRLRCPKCGSDDERMIEREQSIDHYFCNLCAHAFVHAPGARAVSPSALRQTGGGARFASIEALIAATRIHRDELATLAHIGALNAFGYDRRAALWQIERAIRPAGALFEPSAGADVGSGFSPTGRMDIGSGFSPTGTAPSGTPRVDPPVPPLFTPAAERAAAASPPPSALPAPLKPLGPMERVIADYEGTGLTIGPHPMAYRRAEMAQRGVLRAVDLPRARAGRRVRVAGAVITRQRPGTAKGFVFLTLEDETGIANVIIRPDVFDGNRLTVIEEPFLMVEGVLQQQDAVTSVRAERLYGLGGQGPDIASHDFH